MIWVCSSGCFGVCASGVFWVCVLGGVDCFVGDFWFTCGFGYVWVFLVFCFAGVGGIHGFGVVRCGLWCGLGSVLLCGVVGC